MIINPEESTTHFKPQHIPALDGLRGIAILMVLWVHLFQSGAPITNWWVAKFAEASSIGQTGVDLFFVLSGFLITRILLSNKGKQHYFSNFYIRRVLRIFPLYYGFLFVYFIVFPLCLPSWPLDINQIWFWTYTQNIAFTFNVPVEGPNHFWSLAVEEHFYLIWPLIVFSCNNRQLYKTIFISVGICLACRAALMHYGWGTFYFSLCRIDGLVLGAFIALLERENKLVLFKSRLVVTLFLLSLSLATLYIFIGGKAVYWLQLFKSSFIALAFFSLICLLLILQSNHWVHKALSSTFLIFTGKISYGLYVLQGVGFYLAPKLGLYQRSFFVALLGMLLINYTVAYVSFKLYETPFLTLKAKFN